MMSSQSPLSQEPPQRQTSYQGDPVDQRVAVIAVHGVSDQRPYESAQAIADLLLREVPEYSQFRERKIRLTIKPVHIDTQLPSRRETWWDERGNCLRHALDQSTSPITAETESDASHQFLLDQVSAYHKESIYDSICLQGLRHRSSTGPSMAVDIYEMYWADLSRIGTGFVRIFGEFYQLLFHLISLGRQSVDYAGLEQPSHKTVWKRYGDVQAIAGRILALLVPIFNLYLLLAALLSLPGNLPPALATVVLLGSGTVAIFCLTGWFCLHYNLTRFRGWLAIPLLVGILTCFIMKIAYGQMTSTDPSWLNAGYYLLALAWEVILAIVVTFVLILPYNRHRQGVAVTAAIAGVGSSLLAFYFLYTAPQEYSIHEQLAWVSFRTIEGLYVVLFACWSLFVLIYFTSVILGGIVTLLVWMQAGYDWKSLSVSRVVRSTWMARLSLALPALLFSLLTLSLWTALAQVGGGLLPKATFYEPWLLFTNGAKKVRLVDFAHQLTVFSGSSLAAVVMGMIAIVLCIVLWVMLPSVLTEVQPPLPKKPKGTPAASLGQWLSNGFWLMVYALDGIICFVIPVLILMGIIDGLCYLLVWKPIFFVGKNLDLTEQILNGVAGILTASATGLIAFGNRLNQVTVGFRGVLDAMLDVDNYLRVRPADDNPTARIFARYASLLRYLAQGQTVQGAKPYDAVVIIAHSQGTVISADLLRFLQREVDPQLKPFLEDVPIYLFTMGSPLRQLYNFAFPYLYYWIESASAATTEQPSLPAGVLFSTPTPSQLLGVREWVNAYRSGDYIGRSLWLNNIDQKRWEILPKTYQFSTTEKIALNGTPVPRSVTRKDFCIGTGAHTHYWNKYAPDIAKELDQLILRSVVRPVEKGSRNEPIYQ
jgi:hypothetical protein